MTNHEAKYLIRKGAYFYRPNSQGYTARTDDAGRYTLEEARSITHPNGPDGPRDGMSYLPAPEEPEPTDLAGRLIAMNRDFKSVALAAAANEAACLVGQSVRLLVENERFRVALQQCAKLVERNLYRQNEKVEDVVLIVQRALGARAMEGE
ncbi:hypothetical protein I5E68_06960 [Novosphingobium sp. YJ-S2-02]|uniref:Uncharacterized protein n=1 Tax=Novosphingobium aureum TaxID=2792964 RepID=A0A931MKP8_9SPHN|nr:hypothetical protein [Novosphingobium aureum]MBH0112689.1 hypothetical protein [Novosphingobium aureum]